MEKKYPNKFGIELEYMVVDSKKLDVKPVVSDIFKELNNNIPINEITSSKIHWSNELVNHVIELKNPDPLATLHNLDLMFAKEVANINNLLKKYDSLLMPTAMHPWMNPEKETRLWPFSQKEIYKTYDSIFSCTGHGWSNLQSMHINIGFDSDAEFEKLHAATRVVLPLIPIISASSPIYENKVSSQMSSRLMFYLKNQRRIPSILGNAIPEQVWSKKQYETDVLEPMYKDIAPYDKKGLLQFEWLNSRAAIPKFERDSLEIRITDINENPHVDLSIAIFIIKIITSLINEDFSSLAQQKEMDTLQLRKILDDSIIHGSKTVITDTDYLDIFNLKVSSLQGNSFVNHLLKKLNYSKKEEKYFKTIKNIAEYGTLAERMLKKLSKESSSYYDIYKELTECLSKNTFFI